MPPRGEDLDIILVGAGIAGLRCAQELRRRRPALRLVVLDKGRGVGGRCATRRIDGQPVDHGPAFLHGRDPGFLAALRGVPGVLPWPLEVRGNGTPCQPRAFAGAAGGPGAGETHLAFAGGLTAFPKKLAEGLDLRLQTTVTALGRGCLETADGAVYRAPTIVLTSPLPQTADLLDGLLDGLLGPLDAASAAADPLRVLRGVRALLRMLSVAPCLTLIALYPRDRPAPPWDLYHPERGPLRLIAHDSRKRPNPAAHALVLQATPAWSIGQLEDPPEAWTRALLAAAAPYLPRGLGEPTRTSSHRWRYAQMEGGNQLGGPVVVEFGGGCRLGLCGAAFNPLGGAEGAWLAGTALAERLAPST